MADRNRILGAPLAELHDNERIKYESGYLRGRLEESLAEPITGALLGDDHQLTKFFGSYLQDDRDLRDERRRQKLEPAYQFMVRLRLPGGVLNPGQWLALDQLARAHADGTLRLTTRQTFQLHGILKRDIRSTIRAIDSALMDTIGACGDVNRNVLCTNVPEQSTRHREAYDAARRISARLLPRSRAYHEIFLGEKRAAGSPRQDEEPLYGATYLPRKLKIAVAIPPNNDVDIYSNDLGFIAISEGDDDLAGFNITVGGGMGTTVNDTATYPRLADVMGFCSADRAAEVAEAVVSVQRDWGDRVDRKHARLKYTIDDHGLDAFRTEVEARLGFALEEPRYHPPFTDNGDRFGWVRGTDGLWYYTQFVENGRIRDGDEHTLMTGLREIARIHEGDLRITASQNLILGGVSDTARPRIQALLDEHGLTRIQGVGPTRRASMACVAFPTCPLAMAESERYLPELLSRIEDCMADAGLAKDAITVRMSGCHNGCSRPYLGEIGFVGRAVGRYNLYLGAGHAGERLNKLYRENIPEDRILAELDPIIRHYAHERRSDEPFGDFVVRLGYVAAVTAGRTFHD